MNLNNFVFTAGWAAVAFTWFKINKSFLSSAPNALKQKSTPPERNFVFSDDITDYHREVLESLVTTLGYSKTIISVELTKDQVKALSNEDVEKYYKGYKPFIDPYVTSSEEI